MEKIWVTTISVIVGDVIFLGLAFFLLSRYFAERFRKDQESRADTVLLAANEKAREIELEAKDKALNVLQEADNEINRRRVENSREEDRLQKRRAEMDARVERMEQREQALNKRQSALDKRMNDIEKMYELHLDELQRIGQMSVEEARGQLLEEAEKEARGDMARIIRQIEAEARSEGEKRARELIADSIQRVASDHVVSVTTSVVNLPNEEMKGRIVGRNGRNIRAFEQAAGVDVIVDDTPEAVTISCFDPIRREVARRSLSRLIIEGRIHPAHIEKILAEEQKEVDKAIIEAAEEAAYDAGVAGLHPEVLKVLGRLKYRTSYGQNQLSHAVEVARLSAVLAAELGADPESSRMGGLLHDLGKAMDHNTDGTHAMIGAEFAKRYGVPARVVNIIASHHHEVEQETIEAVIVELQMLFPAPARARREDLEQTSSGCALLRTSPIPSRVSTSYAIQAGPRGTYHRPAGRHR